MTLNKSLQALESNAITLKYNINLIDRVIAGGIEENFFHSNHLSFCEVHGNRQLAYMWNVIVIEKLLIRFILILITRSTLAYLSLCLCINHLIVSAKVFSMFFYIWNLISNWCLAYIYKFLWWNNKNFACLINLTCKYMLNIKYIFHFRRQKI